MGSCFSNCCTCAKVAQGVSRFLSYFTLLLTVLSMSIVGWYSKCEACGLIPEGPTYCHFFGLFKWCEATDGRQQCWDFNPRTLDRDFLTRGKYAATQAFMLLSVFMSGFYVAIDIAHWFVRLTQDKHTYVMMYAQEAWFFYVVTGFQGLFALVSQAIWANQGRTSKHITPSCGEVTFHFGPAFALATLVWILCVINIVWRLIFRRYFKDAPEDNVHHVQLDNVAGDSSYAPPS